MILTITKGAHQRNVHLPAMDDEPRQFAHRWDPDEPEDVAHQVQNFLTYAQALGGYVPPIVLIGPLKTDDEVEWAHTQVNMGDWRDMVESATGLPVEIR